MEFSPPIAFPPPLPHHHHRNGLSTIGAKGGIAIVVGSIFGAILSMCVVALCVWICGDRNSNSEGGDLERQDAQQLPSRGLSQKAIDKIPKVSFAVLSARRDGRDDLCCCPVCLSEFQASDESLIWMMPECNHSFHEDCIQKWLATHTSCPMCRVNIKDS